jgi:glycosyltransferase involved in cell wall biosynthesis
MNKIGYVLSNFPVLSETFVSTEIRAMQRCGHQIQPIAFDHYEGQYQAQDELLKTQTIYLCDHSKQLAIKALLLLRPSLFKGLKFALNQQGLTLKSILGNALKLAYFVKQTGCTHLHAHFAQSAAATAIVAARLCGVTVSFVGHGHDIYGEPQDLSQKINAVDFAVAVCRDMIEDFNTIAPKASITLVYCGVDTKRFTPRTTIHKPIVGKDKLLFIGRLCATKGLFTLLDALSYIDAENRPQLDLVGDGVLREALEQHAKKLGLSEQVNFLGAKQMSWFIENAVNYAAMISPFEMAENGDRDSGPVVVKEAMAMKLPIITTYFMGCKEMLTEQCALRVQPKDASSLSKMITQFYNMSTDEITLMVDNGFERVYSLYCADVQAKSLSAMVEQT